MDLIDYLDKEKIKKEYGDDVLVIQRKYFEKNYISKDKIREKIKAFKSVKQEIFRLENKLGNPSITYDIVRNDYCEKMLEDLLKE